VSLRKSEVLSGDVAITRLWTACDPCRVRFTLSGTCFSVPVVQKQPRWKAVRSIPTRKKVKTYGGGEEEKGVLS
jgi:hypothetical protein